jgi:uncharacterized protein
MTTGPDAAGIPALQYTLKVTSRCNLACSYCYVYAKGDDTWRAQPRFMTEAVLARTVERIREHCELVGQGQADIVFHGGEPTLIGPARFAEWCSTIRAGLPGLGVRLTLQTNGTLLDAAWAEVLGAENVTVGVSIDGPEAVHDEFRVDFAGRGSHAKVLRGLDHLRQGGVPFNILSVVNLDQDPLEVHRHLSGLGPRSVSYLMPDNTWETIAAVRRQYGPRPVATFLGAILDQWWTHGMIDLTVQPFKEMARAVLGGVTAVDYIGNRPYNYVFVEPDGAIEGLDVLRICQPGLAQTGLDVFHHAFRDIASLSPLHRAVLFDGLPLPGECRACPERSTCAGGYVPHRFDGTGFDHASAWCADLLALFAHVRRLLDVTPEETEQRRTLLRDLATVG